MNFPELNFNIPSELIAQEPASPRDSCRLLIVDRTQDGCYDRTFRDLLELLGPRDVLVLNNSKVIKARLQAQKPTGGKAEIFLHRHLEGRRWEVMLRGRGLHTGLELHLNQGLVATICARTDDTYVLEFNHSGPDFERIIADIGEVPVPPYIKRKARLEDYQNVFATQPGSVAAPTAGLHFTPELLAHLREKGVQIEYVTLHVGLGTFKPIKTQDIEDHVMHSEEAYISSDVAKRLNKAKRDGRRIIAVGTTTVRTLESFTDKSNLLSYGSTETNIFIRPPYAFKFVDALITNFHLPDSTLILLVAALADVALTRKAYLHAIQERYRFYSFGDAMFIQ